MSKIPKRLTTASDHMTASAESTDQPTHSDKRRDRLTYPFGQVDRKKIKECTEKTDDGLITVGYDFDGPIKRRKILNVSIQEKILLLEVDF